MYLKSPTTKPMLHNGPNAMQSDYHRLAKERPLEDLVASALHDKVNIL